MAMLLPTKTFFHTNGYCPYSETYSNPAHSMGDFLQEPYQYGMSCNDLSCQKRSCKILQKKFGVPMIHCVSKKCLKEGCRFLISCTPGEIKLSNCYKIGESKPCGPCSNIIETEIHIEENKKEIEKENQTRCILL